MRIALLTTPTKPRGGVVHTLALAEALARSGARTSTSGASPGTATTASSGPVDGAVGLRLVPFPTVDDETVGARVLRSIWRSASLRGGRARLRRRPRRGLHLRQRRAGQRAGRAPHRPPPRPLHHPGARRLPREGASASRSPTSASPGPWPASSTAGWGLTPEIIANGVDAGRGSRPLLPTTRRRPRHGSTGRTASAATCCRSAASNRARGRSSLIEAMGTSATGGPDVPLVLAGGRDALRLPRVPVGGGRRAAELDIRRSCSGRCRTRTCPGLVAGAAAFAFPSRQEGFGLAAMEALAAGVPLVARDLPVLRGRLRHRRPGCADEPHGFAAPWPRLPRRLDDPDGVQARTCRSRLAGRSTAGTPRRGPTSPFYDASSTPACCGAPQPGICPPPRPLARTDEHDRSTPISRPFRARRRRRRAGQAGLSMSWLLQSTRGIEHVVARAVPGRCRVADPAVGLVQPRHAELAVPAARLALPRRRSRRLHGPRRDRRLPRGLRRLLRPAAVRRGRGDQAAPGERRPANSASTPRPGAASPRTRWSSRPARYQLPRIPRLAERLPAAHRPAALVAVPEPGRAAGRAPCSWSAPASPGRRSPRTCTSPGRQVHLATGTSPRCSRFYRGRDVVAWLHDMGYYDLPVERRRRGRRRHETNHYVTGRDGGHDLDLRAFALEGMRALRPPPRPPSGRRLTLRRRPRRQPRPRRRGATTASTPDRQPHRRAAASTPRRGCGLRTGLAARAERGRGARPGGRGRRRRLGARLRPRATPGSRCRCSTGAATRRTRGASPASRASTCSVCRGCTPGAPAGSPAWPGTPRSCSIASTPSSAPRLAPPPDQGHEPRPDPERWTPVRMLQSASAGSDIWERSGRVPSRGRVSEAAMETTAADGGTQEVQLPRQAMPVDDAPRPVPARGLTPACAGLRQRPRARRLRAGARRRDHGRRAARRRWSTRCTDAPASVLGAGGVLFVRLPRPFLTRRRCRACRRPAPRAGGAEDGPRRSDRAASPPASTRARRRRANGSAWSARPGARPSGRCSRCSGVARVDVARVGTAGLTRWRPGCGDRPIALFVEAVETLGQLEACRRVQAEFLSGEPRRRPPVVADRGLAPSQLACLRLATALVRPDVDLTEVELAVRSDPALTMRVLKAVNSAAGRRAAAGQLDPAGRRPARPPRPARLRARPPACSQSGAGTPPEAVEAVLVRARMCELLATTGADRPAAPRWTAVPPSPSAWSPASTCCSARPVRRRRRAAGGRGGRGGRARPRRAPRRRPRRRPRLRGLPAAAPDRRRRPARGLPRVADLGRPARRRSHPPETHLGSSPADARASDHERCDAAPVCRSWRRARVRRSSDPRRCPAAHSVGAASDDAVHLGRQPVFDADLTVVGYELLFRRAGSTTAQVADPEQATADVVVKTFADFGLEAVVGDKLAFVNLPRGFLTGAKPLPFAPEQVVLEILEDVVADAEVLDGIRRLKDAGLPVRPRRLRLARGRRAAGRAVRLRQARRPRAARRRN